MSAPLATRPRTDVYFNLHSHKWSMLDRRTGRVYDHARVVMSSLPVALVVQPAGQRRVVQTGQKNVHAFVRGSYLEPVQDLARWQAYVAGPEWVAVSYNPFRGPTFYRKDTGEDLTEAQAIVMLAPREGAPLVKALL